MSSEARAKHVQHDPPTWLSPPVVSCTCLGRGRDVQQVKGRMLPMRDLTLGKDYCTLLYSPWSG